MKTLVAIPCHNEGLAIGPVVLKARKYVDEVLLVDDGSTDDAAEVAEDAGAVVGKGCGVCHILRMKQTIRGQLDDV